MTANANAPEIDEVIFLQDDEEKIEFEEYTKIENAGTFTFNKEDHTLGNLLKIQLLKDPCIRFSGYTMPSPGVGFPHRFDLRVQTDGTKTPTAALQDAINALILEVQKMEDQLTDGVEDYKRTHSGQ
eukprot:SAG11_NODE_804_length_7096_cov_14.131056_2_plen_127_part_00